MSEKYQIYFCKMNNKNDQLRLSKLKPLCINFLRDSNLENIDNLNKTVQNLDPKFVQSFQEYIVLPVRAQLKTELDEKVAIKCINLITYVFKKSKVETWSLFSHIFVLMLSKISDPKEIDKLCKASEKLKLSVCENILYLVRSATEEILNEMFSLSFRPNLAHAFHLFNILLVHGKSKSLKTAVLSTIGALSYNEMFIGKKFRMTEAIASEALVSCFPGVSIALQKVACSDIKQGHEISAMTLNVLADLIVCVVGDDSFRRNIVKDTSSEIYSFAYKTGKLSSPLPSDVKEPIPVVLKDESWFNIAAQNLKIIIDNLTVLGGHADWEVRFEFVKFASSILLKCTETLKACKPLLLPAVFGLSMDDNEQISQYCADLLSSIS